MDIIVNLCGKQTQQLANLVRWIFGTTLLLPAEAFSVCPHYILMAKEDMGNARTHWSRLLVYIH